MTDPVQQMLVAARKNQILEAAAAVFAEKGFHATTTKDVAKRAGVSEGTIYNYFENKTALLLSIFERMKSAVIQDNPQLIAPDLDLETFVRQFVEQPLRGLQQDNFGLFRIIISEILVNEELKALYYSQVLEPTITLAVTHLAPHAEQWGLDVKDTGLLVRMISSMMMGLMIEYIMGDPLLVDEWDHLPEYITKLIVNGLKNFKA